MRSSFAIDTMPKKLKHWSANCRWSCNSGFDSVNAEYSTQRILGIDFGRARIGLAISDELQFLAHPLETIDLSKTKNAVSRVAELVVAKNVREVVVGLARHMNGEMSDSAKEAVAFAEKIRGKVSCSVRTWDERLTTVAAHRALREAGKSTRQTRGIVDQVAAQIILQSYLDSRAVLRVDSEEASPLESC
jgi:putative Holliday junction resolvase